MIQPFDSLQVDPLYRLRQPGAEQSINQNRQIADASERSQQSLFIRNKIDMAFSIFQGPQMNGSIPLDGVTLRQD